MFFDKGTIWVAIILIILAIVAISIDRKKKGLLKKKKTHEVKGTKLTASQWLFVILRLIVFLILIHDVLNKNYENVFICILTLFLFVLPFIIERKFKINIPDVLEIIILLFIFSAEILGELNSFYTIFPRWDDMLHTTNGFIMGAIGLSLIDLLNNSKEFKIKLSPLFVAFVSFCFSMTIGVCWEFFEFGMDRVFHLDMQKDSIVEEINSVTFDPNNLNKIHSIKIDSLEVNGEDWIELYGGYIDIGLIDTMKDLIVNFIGAFTFSVIGYFYSKSEDNKKIKKLLIVAN